MKELIFNLSKTTFGIYLVHYLIKTKLESLGYQQIFFVDRPNILFHFAYFIVYGFIIFILSLLVVIIIDKIRAMFADLVIKINKK